MNVCQNIDDLSQPELEPPMRRSLFWCVRTVAVAVAMSVCIFWATATYFRISSFRDLIAYGGMAAECHPIWLELAFRRIQPGEDFRTVLQDMPPDSQEQLGEYAFYDYGVGFTALRIYTKSGKVVSAGAGSCTWDYSFFNTFSPDDWAELNARYALLLDQRYRDDSSAADEAPIVKLEQSVDVE
jgi:hypothetical protein